MIHSSHAGQFCSLKLVLNSFMDVFRSKGYFLFVTFDPELSFYPHLSSLWRQVSSLSYFLFLSARYLFPLFVKHTLCDRQTWDNHMHMMPSFFNRCILLSLWWISGTFVTHILCLDSLLELLSDTTCQTPNCHPRFMTPKLFFEWYFCFRFISYVRLTFVVLSGIFCVFKNAASVEHKHQTASSFFNQQEHLHWSINLTRGTNGPSETVTHAMLEKEHSGLCCFTTEALLLPLLKAHFSSLTGGNRTGPVGTMFWCKFRDQTVTLKHWGTKLLTV